MDANGIHNSNSVSNKMLSLCNKQKKNKPEQIKGSARRRTPLTES